MKDESTFLYERADIGLKQRKKIPGSTEFKLIVQQPDHTMQVNNLFLKVKFLIYICYLL